MSSGIAVFHFDVAQVVAELLGCTRIDAKSRILAKAIELGFITEDDVCSCPAHHAAVCAEDPEVQPSYCQAAPRFATAADEAMDKVTRKFSDYMPHKPVAPQEQAAPVRTNAIAGEGHKRGVR